MIVQLVVASGNREGQVIPISVEKFIIGRAADCHLVSRSELISRYHCAIHIGDEVVVRDLGSRNGVRLNGEKINTEQRLKNGDSLAMGPLEFYVHIATNGDATAGGSGMGKSEMMGGLSSDAGAGPTEPTVLLNSANLQNSAKGGNQ